MLKEWLLCNIGIIIYGHEDLFFLILFVAISCLGIFCLARCANSYRASRGLPPSSNCSHGWIGSLLLRCDAIVAVLMSPRWLRYCRVALALVLSVSILYIVLSAGRCQSNDELISYLQTHGILVILLLFCSFHFISCH
jgi:hypothetical protein